MTTSEDIQTAVQQFYKERVSKKATSSNPHCENFKNMEHLPKAVREAVGSVHCDIIKKSFSCGSPFPPALDGCRILDLGCGTGKDCYALSKLVGSKGSIVGVDMLPEMIAFARKYLKHHADKFGYDNVEFKHGYLEALEESSKLSENQFDVVTSNCVITLCPEKAKVYRSAYNVLREGGEMFFSDVYAEEKVSDQVKFHNEAYNEGFGGAIAWADFVDLVQSIGFLGPFVVKSSAYDPFNNELKAVVGESKYFSKTVRLIKPKTLSDCHKDSLTTVLYSGSVQHYDNKFILDQDNILEAGLAAEIPEYSARSLRLSRYEKFFQFSK